MTSTIIGENVDTTKIDKAKHHKKYIQTKNPSLHVVKDATPKRMLDQNIVI